MSGFSPKDFAGIGPRPESLDGAYWLGMEGTDGNGGTDGSKSAGMLLKRVEYLLLTRSEVYKSQLGSLV